MQPVFNPPPGWPQLEQTWTPQWRPDPRLPEAPYGWVFWLRPRTPVPSILGMAIAVTVALVAAPMVFRRGPSVSMCVLIGMLVLGIVSAATRPALRAHPWQILITAVVGAVGVSAVAIFLTAMMYI
jgi:hypothetical protein